MKRELWMCVWIYIEIVIVGIISGSSGIADKIWARETQKATCQVIGEKLVASASATVTHALEGICTSKEINQYFKELKNEIAIQINDLKSLFQDITKEVSNHRSKMENEQKSSDQSKVSSAPQKPKNFDKLRYSNFFNTGSEKEEFSYIWKVNVSQIKISGLNKLSIMKSPDFYTDWGYRMYIKLFPQQNKGNIYIHVGLTHGQWDDVLQWPFRLKHQLVIQDHAGTEANDLISQVWDPSVLCNDSYWQKPIIYQDNDECVGFGFNPDNIFTKLPNYKLDGHILIKLNVIPLY